MQRVDPFPASEFDQWAGSYDEDVVTNDRFPFAGYQQVLRTIQREADARAGMTVLDVGVGTGNLARLFLMDGCRVWGVDYSPAMLEKARAKLPEVMLVLHDLRAAWPKDLDRRFDRIVSAYTLHHFELDRKVSLLSELSRDRLETGGRIVIADISFPSLTDMQAFAGTVGEAWEQEPYWLADETQAALRAARLQCSYQQVSACGGVYRIEPAA
jgi:putative AdoMet-dependent methyltransferase